MKKIVIFAVAILLSGCNNLNNVDRDASVAKAESKCREFGGKLSELVGWHLSDDRGDARASCINVQTGNKFNLYLYLVRK